MRTNVLVRELDLHPGQNRLDARRLEVVVDGLELFNGAQLAADTTSVAALRADGTVSQKGATVGGEALKRARARKERTCPELAGEGDWWFLLQKWVDVGQTKLPSSCVLWRGPKHKPAAQHPQRLM